MITFTNPVQSPLSEKIKIEFNKLMKTVSLISEGYLKLAILDGTGGKISVIDLIAYQIGWGKLLISWYEAGIKGEDLNLPGEGFTTWDYTGLARHFYNKYKYDSLESQLSEFYKVVSKIIEITETEYKTGNLDQLKVWSWCTLQSGKDWPLSKWITVNTVAPYRRAITMIRKLAKNVHLY